MKISKDPRDNWRYLSGLRSPAEIVREIETPKSLLRKLFPEIEATLREAHWANWATPQNGDWHQEGPNGLGVVGWHIAEVVSKTWPLTGGSCDNGLERILILAAYLHDIRKPKCAKPGNYGKIIFPGHERAGVDYVKKLNLKPFGLDDNQRRALEWLILNHHVGHDLTRNTARHTVEQWVRHYLFSWSFRLHEADCLGVWGDRRGTRRLPNCTPTLKWLLKTHGIEGIIIPELPARNWR